MLTYEQRIEKAKKTREAFERRLSKEGFECSDRNAFDRRAASNADLLINPPRFCYTNGSWRILTENKECPWWTVQKVIGRRVEWFVDFPTNIKIDTVFKFMEVA